MPFASDYRDFLEEYEECLVGAADAREYAEWMEARAATWEHLADLGERGLIAKVAQPRFVRRLPLFRNASVAAASGFLRLSVDRGDVAPDAIDVLERAVVNLECIASSWCIVRRTPFKGNRSKRRASAFGRQWRPHNGRNIGRRPVSTTGPPGRLVSSSPIAAHAPPRRSAPCGLAMVALNDTPTV